MAGFAPLNSKPGASAGPATHGRQPAARAPWADFVQRPQVAPSPRVQRSAVTREPAERSDGNQSGKSACRCGASGATSDPCTGCTKVLEAASLAPVQASVKCKADGFTTIGSGRTRGGRDGWTRAHGLDRAASDGIGIGLAERSRRHRRGAPLAKQLQDARSAGGEVMPNPVRGDMERRFGRAFDGVRVHRDHAADKLAGQVSAGPSRSDTICSSVRRPSSPLAPTDAG